MKNKLHKTLAIAALAIAVSLTACLLVPKAFAADTTKPNTAKTSISDKMWKDLYVGEVTSKIAVHAALLRALDQGATNTIRFILLSSLTNSVNGIEGIENIQLTDVQVKAISIGKDALSTYAPKPSKDQ